MAEQNFREITERDIPALFAVRTRTHENCLTIAELESLGITEETVGEMLCSSCKGWLCEMDREIVGFAIGDRATGELCVIAVLPVYLRMGIGSSLLKKVEDWLHAQGCTTLWLTTDIDPNMSAYSFYRQYGWRDDRIEDNMRYMIKP